MWISGVQSGLLGEHVAQARPTVATAIMAAAVVELKRPKGGSVIADVAVETFSAVNFEKLLGLAASHFFNYGRPGNVHDVTRGVGFLA